MITDAYYMWIKNPLANNIIELFLDFVLGDGITLKANDDLVLEVMNSFWNDHDNDWDMQGEKRIRDLSLYGELILEPFESKFTGKIKITSLWPGNVSKIHRDEHNPEKIAALEFSNRDDTLEIIKFDEKNSLYLSFSLHQLFYLILYKFCQPHQIRLHSLFFLYTL